VSTFYTKDKNIYTCTVSGSPTYSKLGRTLNSATPDYIAVGTWTAINAWTASIWFKCTTLPADGSSKILVAKWKNAAPAGTLRDFFTRVYRSGATIGLEAYAIEGDAVATAQYRAGSVAVNTWYQAVFNFDKTRGVTARWLIYLNSVLQANTVVTEGAPTIGGTVEPVWIGALDNIAAPLVPFDGIIGEVRFDSVNLTQAQISHNYQATRWRYGV